MTPDQVRETVATLIEEEPASIGADANLFELGLDSIDLMRLVGEWRRDGFEVDFAQLAENPTVSGWERLLGAPRVVEPAPAGPGGTTTSTAPLSPGADGPLFPLALLQHAYWVGRDEGQPLGGVAAHLYLEFDGSGVEPDRLRAATRRLVQRHPMLRARVTDNGEQEVLAESGWRGLTVHDLRELPADEVARRLDSTRTRMSHEMLAIEDGEVLATALSLLPGGRTRFHLDVDMVAADAVSYRVMLADLAALYEDPTASLTPIGYTYREYLESRPAARSAAARRAAGYWRDRLSDLPGAPELPTTGGPGGPARAKRLAFTLSPEQKTALQAAARRRAVTPAMVVTTAFAEVIGAWSAQSRFLLNVPMFDREPVHPDINHVVGDFTSSVLLEVDLTEPLTFTEQVRRGMARLHTDASNADYSGVEVVRDLSRASGQQVIAPVVFTSGLGLGELFDERARRLFGDPVWIISQGPQVLLDAQISEIDGGVIVNWDIRENEIAPGAADAMFDAFRILVSELAQDGPVWDRPVGDLLPPGQRRARDLANDTGSSRTGRLLHQDFFALAKGNPGAPAVLWGVDGVVDYAGLADRALRIAGALSAAGVRPGDLVGITLPQGPDQVAAALGVLAAGGAYVPVGIEQPAARARRIAEVAGFEVVITESVLRDALNAEPLAAPVILDTEAIAYVLFTSGSTGEPKGVEVPHRAAMATIDDLVERLALGPADRTIGLSALDFDLSVFDMFAPLSTGGSILTVDEETRRDARSWADLVAQREVTILNCVPALLDMMLAAGIDRSAVLRAVLLGGDRVGVDLPGRLADVLPGCRFLGLGGTTETAIHSTICEVSGGPVPEHWRCVPYGTPLRGVALRVVDHLGRDAPDWVPGELWIGGDGVAHGYRRDPRRTADRFVTVDGRRWYRTGDLARYNPGGTVEFLGRRDNQVKIRGFRIELGEVEAALGAQPGVGTAVAVLVTAAGAAPVLCAAVTGAVDPEVLRTGVTELVPPHMVPERIVVLDRIPLSSNGKLDRRAVTERLAALTGPVGTRVAPRTAVERAIALVWSEFVPAAEIGVTESLFALGGDSVLATRIVARLREGLDQPAVSVRMLFAEPTIEGLARRMGGAEGGGERLEQVAEIFLEIESLSEADLDAELGEVR